MGARILVIEDNEANLDLMRYLLRAFGHAVIAARDGATGLAQAASDRPDLVLCDIQLPDIDGGEVARRMRAHAGLERIPLVAVTALAMVGDRETILAAGFDGYLAKPITPETFVSQVEAFLPPGLHGTTPAATAGEAAAPAAPRPRRTILVVDDKAENRELAVGIFGPSGYEVLTAPGTRSALALARRSRPDLILSDVVMQDGSGFELIGMLKDDLSLRDTPFVFITSTMTNEAARAQGLALGAARFIFRPIDTPELLAQIEECLRGHDPDR